MPQDFANLKILLRYSSVVSFISTGHVIVKFKVFCIDSAPMKWLLFGVFLELIPLNIVRSCLKFDQR